MTETALAVRDHDHRELTPEQIDLVKRTIMPPDSTDDELALFVQTCNRVQLDPFARQIYATKRRQKVKKWDPAIGQRVETWEARFQIGVTIDGFRTIAERTHEMDGHEGPFWCGPDGEWVDVWLKKEAPSAARIVVWRKGAQHPFSGVALFDEYAAKFNDGNPMAMWAKMPASMLAKCAEALALRKAFPQDLSGLYTEDEMDQAGIQRPEGPIEGEVVESPVEPKPKRKRRTKAEMEAARAAERIDEALAEAASEVAAEGDEEADLGLVTEEAEVPEPPADPEPEPAAEEQVWHLALREQLGRMAGFREWNLTNVVANARKHFQREDINEIADLTEDESEKVRKAAIKFLEEKQRLAEESL